MESITTEAYNRIVIIGNGFDKALGLKTGYSDFILNYLQNAVINTIKQNIYETDLIKLKLTEFRNISLPANEEVEIIANMKSVKDLKVHLKDKIEITHKYDFFERILKKFDSSNWIDIEQYYFKILTLFWKTQGLDHVKSLNECMNLLTLALNDFISAQQELFEIDKIADQYPLRTLFAKLQESNVIDEAEFLVRHNREGELKKIIFLNFNYTNSVMNFINNAFLSVSHDHISIHGRVNDKLNPIIFGYGNDTGIAYNELEEAGVNELLKKIKSFHYPYTNNYHKLLNYLDLNKFEVFIIGHSCGLSDKTLLRTIFEHKHCISIQNFHYRGWDEDFNKRLEISRHFSDKVLMRDRMLPFDERAYIPQHKIDR